MVVEVFLDRAVLAVAVGLYSDTAGIWRNRPKIMEECYGGNHR